jgi:TPR repeat protein
MAWNQGFSDQENLQWSMLRAIEWGIWPAFLSQSIVPVLLIVFEWWEVIGVFIILTILWSFVRYRYVNVAMARFGVFFVLLKWITVPAGVIYLLVQRNYISAIVALLWPIFLAPYFGIFIGGTKIGKIQEMFMAQLGYSEKQPPESDVNDDARQGVPQDYTQAAALYRKNAEQDNADAQFNLGYLYDKGQGVPQDYAQAAFWYRKAAERGVARAQFNLGVLYHDGHGVPQDYVQVATWFRKAAEQGDALAQGRLGLMYDNGQGVPQDHAQAAFWWHKAADRGDAWAQYSLGYLYDNGQGVSQDYTQAAAWYRKAGEQGFASAQFKLGVLYCDGQGVPQNYIQAAFWWRKAAEQGDTQAQYNLGLSCAKGRGVPRDYTQAAFWWRKSTEQGYAMAQYNLGILYHNGQGVPRDYAEAYFWSDIAAAGKLDASLAKVAAKSRDESASHLTPADQYRVQQKVRKWFEANQAKPQ